MGYVITALICLIIGGIAGGLLVGIFLYKRTDGEILGAVTSRRSEDYDADPGYGTTAAMPQSYVDPGNPFGVQQTSRPDPFL